MCREEGADPDQFGLGSQSDLRGWTEIVGEIRLDLASLNRIEMLCWDTWGIGSSEPFDSFSDEDKLLLDRVAKSTFEITPIK